MIVAIEGIDGAGKNTLTRALVTALETAGRRVGTLAFPRYAVAPLGPAVRAMLTGDQALAPVAASVRASALLFALDRANARPELAAAAASDDVVLVDRYVASNAAYGAARLPAAERPAFRDWVAALELGDLALPRPGLQVLLRVPVEVARARARSRAAADADRAIDRYEADDALQTRVAHEYEELARAAWAAPWRTVDPAETADAVGKIISDLL
ncbi:dTMP kinase [Frankia sp. CNm7]|uniref:Thymidylate kinase n=1 Tax=Frankia nepalensis TaxID=1836974 RepID=A0A937RMA7_9ACTN|nr:dTMP kinase [Frankia nepalensis]MBL7500711.1 dTMP kinase [Frankia nepalensis]MBL7514462.1 dTMP kinase [Frankia nepalensis]MBL7523549.1 dTMP kinase [Frankia nepalensis]MBL7632737.1 dTMP kinase [Frankia nepalensis]